MEATIGQWRLLEDNSRTCSFIRYLWEDTYISRYFAVCKTKVFQKYLDIWGWIGISKECLSYVIVFLYCLTFSSFFWKQTCNDVGTHRMWDLRSSKAYHTHTAILPLSQRPPCLPQTIWKIQASSRYRLFQVFGAWMYDPAHKTSLPYTTLIVVAICILQANGCAQVHMR